MTLHNLMLDPTDIAAEEQAFRRLFAQRLNTALDEHTHIPSGHGRIAAVAALFGINRVTATKWLSGEGLPELWRLPILARLLNVDVNELVGGTASPMLIDERYASIDMHSQDHPDEVSALYLQPGVMRSAGLAPGCLLMQVTTNDMAGYAGVGDMVIYNPGVKWVSSGNDVYLFRVAGQYVLRRATRSLRGDITLTSDSTGASESFKGEDFTSDANDKSNAIYVVGRVVARVLLREAASR